MLAGMTIDSFKLSEPWHLTNDEELVLFEHRGGSAIALVWQGSDVFFLSHGRRCGAPDSQTSKASKILQAETGS